MNYEMDESGYNPTPKSAVATLTSPQPFERKLLTPSPEPQKPIENRFIHKVVGEKIVGMDTRTGSITTIGGRNEAGLASSRMFNPKNPDDQRMAEELKDELEKAEVFDSKNPEHKALIDSKPNPETNIKIEIRDREHIVTNAETGEEIRRMPVVEGAAGVIDTPEPVDVDTPDKAKIWLEGILRTLERSPNKINPTIEDSLEGTITAAIKDLPGYTHEIPGSGPPPQEEGLKAELLRRAIARIKYHNASYDARFSGKEFAGDFTKINPDEHIEIFSTKGVKESLTYLITVNNGEFFRLGGQDAETRRNFVRTNLQAVNGLTATEARLALELAEKTAHVFGESAYFDGIRNNAGNWVHFEADGEIDDAAGNPLPKADLEGYATYFVEHWDEIDKNSSLSGQGAGQLRQAMWYPIQLEKPGTKNKGAASYLRRYAYLWVPSYARFQSPDIGGSNGLLETIDFDNNYGRFQSEFRKVYAWGPVIGSAFENRVQLNDKGKESVLNSPFVKPNIVTDGNSDKTLPKALENFLKTGPVYQHLPFEEQQTALAHLYKGMQEFMNGANNNESRKKPFSYWGWNSAIKLDAIRLLADEEIITRPDAADLLKNGKISLSKAGVVSAGGEALEGMAKFLQQLSRLFKIEI